MNVGLLKLTGNILYFIGALMIVIPLLALVVTGGMVILAGYVVLLTPVVGAVLVGVGKRMIKNAQRLDEENRANKELMDKHTREMSGQNNLTT